MQPGNARPASMQAHGGYAAAERRRGESFIEPEDENDIPIVDEDEDVEDSDDDDIVDDVETQEDDLTLLEARSYGRKTPKQREERREDIQVCSCWSLPRPTARPHTCLPVSLFEAHPDWPLGEQRLNRADVWAQEDLQNALEVLRELAPSQKSVLHLASCLQDSLQLLVESNEKSKPKFSVRFNGSQEVPGSATKGELTQKVAFGEPLSAVSPRAIKFGTLWQEQAQP
jgi:hypothetical protein